MPEYAGRAVSHGVGAGPGPEARAGQGPGPGHADLLDAQARACAGAGSPLSSALLAAAEDVRRGGLVAGVLAAQPGDPGPALGLRLLAAVHRLALERRAPALALHLPSVGGTAGLDGAGAAFVATVAGAADEVVRLVARPCQTNEVGRCAPLLVGLLGVARGTGRPLRVLELGASAGLLLRSDRYRYTSSRHGWAWGDRPRHWSSPNASGRSRPPPPSGSSTGLAATRAPSTRRAPRAASP